MFLFDEEELAPQVRAQRTINRARVPEIARYMLDNPKDYVFSAITASVDGTVSFKAINNDNPKVGRLTIPMSARFVINDGQHRRAAVEEALAQCPDFADETISVVLFIDAGLKRSQQMFADLNRHAVRPTRSIGVLYDHRDPLSQLARDIAVEVEVFKGLTEVEKTTISNRSKKLFTLSSIYSSTRRLLRKGPKAEVSSDEAALAKEFWTEVASNMPDWCAAARGEVASAELRSDFIHSHGVALQALAIAGADLLAAHPKTWKKKLQALHKVDWARNNAELWEGRATIGGKVSKAEANVKLTANVLRQTLDVPLGAEDAKAEKRFSSRREAA